MASGSNTISTVVHVCEDTNKAFDITQLMIQAGFTPPANFTIEGIAATDLATGDLVEGDSTLLRQVDGDTIEFTPANIANFNGQYQVITLILDIGADDFLFVEVQVVVDPVNDAPAGEDKSIDLVDGSPYILSTSDFGFSDVVESNGFKSVFISSLPFKGTLLLDGVAVAAGTDVSVADIQAGKLSFVPDANSSGNVEFGFQVRDDGGTAGCNASDLDLSPNHITFNVPYTSLGDFVFNDDNRNGLQDATETGVAGVTVTLHGAGADGMFGTSDDTTDVRVTDSTGHYLFDHLNAGKYQAEFSGIAADKTFTVSDQGINDAIDSDVDASGNTGVISLLAGQANTSVDAGLVSQLGAIGDLVFLDANDNGVQDAGDFGLSDMTVKLTGAGLDGTFGTADDTTETTLTDANGNYLFSGLTAGKYQVAFSNSPYESISDYTLSNVGSDDTIDSDAGAGGLTQVVDLLPGETNLSLDGGLVLKKASLGDFVFIDTNGNGVQDAGDTGVAGVSVTLTGAGNDGAFGTADDTTTATITDINGKYEFTGLTGFQSYKVQFSNLPAGYEFTSRYAGGDEALDSDADASGLTQSYVLSPGENLTTVDAGLVALKGTIGDTVFFDRNENGLQDSDEIGVGGVTVTLTGAGADGVLGTGDDTTAVATTDANGKYLFTDLTAGKYQVGYSNIPSIANYTLDHVGSDTTIDSNANPSTGLTEVVELAAGQVDLTVDGGLVLKHGAIGDFVFKDTNGNGIQDATEAGVAGVTVSLKGAGLDGTWGTADDVSRSTTTDANGKYLFSDLQTNQNYQVVFSNVPAGYEFTQANAGSDRAKDSNAAADGTTVGIYLAPAETNTTIDAGIVAKKVCVGDQVFVDKNKNGVQDAGDVGLAGVTVTIKGAGLDGVFGTADDTSKTTTTDNTGRYMFHDLAGDQDYKVSFSGAPAGYAATVKGAGSNANLDSDIDASGTTGVFHVNAGVDRFDIDAGFVNNNKLNACVGDRVWHDTNKNGIQDCGECGAAGVTVTLIGAGEDNAFGTADDTLATTKTDCQGNYKFSCLSSGLQYQLQFGTIFGYTWTAKDQGCNDTVDSDAGACGFTAAFTLKSGECNTTFDAGLVCKPTACVGDRVWNDANCNGIQDAGESGLACVTVKLTGAGADGLFGTCDDICKVTTTDCNGYYKFTGLIGDSQYKIDVTAPCNYSFTGKDTGTNDAIDSDVNGCGTSDAFFLAAGQNKCDVDAGLFKTVTACLTGSTVLYEGRANSYKVVLSSALTTDSWVTVTALDGTAKRTGYDASVQSYDYRGTVQAMNKDYALLGTDCIIDADGVISVKIAAGQTSSAAFSVTAWKEKETVEILAPGVSTGAYKEAAWEDLTLQLTSSNVQVNVTCANTTVKIGDTTSYSLYSPIALDMDGNGIHTTALIDSKGTFDLLGNGHAVNSGWLSSGDAFLAIDNNSNGKIDSVSELFGGNKGEGFAKLSSFDTNGDGLVDAKDADFGKLLVWQDLNGDHATDAGELRTLGEAGIASLNTGFTDGAIDQLGNILGETSLATRTDGTQITTTDVYFNTDVAGASLPELGSLLSSTNALLDQAFGAAPAAAPAAPAANDAMVTADAETLRQLAALLEQHAVAA
jgi:serine-aspartate repeat-containing protein C/D/E